MMEKIAFVAESGETVEFFVEEQTRVNGTDYLLVSDSLGDAANAYILKDVSEMDSPDAEYVFVEDEAELEIISHLFSQMLDNVEVLVEEK